jgi:predicted TIM-barrel fold metal-dependent hydrolase
MYVGMQVLPDLGLRIVFLPPLGALCKHAWQARRVRDDKLLRPWWEQTTGLVPGLEIFDAHTHIGANDPDGFKATADEILAALELAGGRGIAFPFHEPNGYHDANDHVLAAAQASGGRLYAFCRLDPRHENAPAEAERLLDAGARGIKLHPRSEQFELDEPEVRRVFEIAHERRVPVLIHAGRGIPALGRHAVEMATALPDARVILAHCGISDLSWIWRDAQRVPNLYFDTSWWSPADVFATLTLVPPGQVLFASDTPYGTPLQHSLFVIRCALQAGLSDAQVRGVMGGQIERLVNGQEPLDLGPASGAREGAGGDVLLARVATFLATAIGRLFSDTEADELLALARLASFPVDDDPRRPVFESIVRLLDLYEEHGEVGGPDARGLHLIVTAICLASTPGVPLAAGG